jgi:hypothetical protein
LHPQENLAVLVQWHVPDALQPDDRVDLMRAAQLEPAVDESCLISNS